MNLPASGPIRAARLIRAFVLAPWLLSLGGCFLFPAKPLVVGRGLTTKASVLMLAESPGDQRTFATAFPEVHAFRLSSRVLARPGRLFGKILLDVSVISVETGAVRMQGRHPGDQTTLFDLAAEGDRMQVYVPPARAVFQGAIGPEGSPFGQAIGIEPADLASVILIARRIAQEPFQVVPGKRLTKLLPAAPPPDGLVEVQLETVTGLPRAAKWRRGGSTWKVEYLEWDGFGDGKGPPNAYPMPSKIQLARSSPYARIEISRRPQADGAPTETSSQYLVNPDLDPRTFNVPVPKGTETRSLESLGPALGLK